MVKIMKWMFLGSMIGIIGWAAVSLREEYKPKRRRRYTTIQLNR